MDPILFRVPWINLPVQAYSGMLALSFLVGWLLVMRLGRSAGYERGLLASAFTWAAISALVGSRVLYIVANPAQFESAPILAWFNLRNGGIVAYGGFLGGFLGSWIYLRWKRQPLLPWADIVAPALASGLGITRIGCFLQGCDFGRPVTEAAPSWVHEVAVRFPNWDVVYPDLQAKAAVGLGWLAEGLRGAPAYLHHVQLGIVEPGSRASAPVYPTQLLESAVGWSALVLLLLVRRRQRFEGQLLLLFALYYGVMRTLLEILRGDTQRGGVGPLSTSQLIGLATVALASLAWPILARRSRPAPPR